MRRYFWDLLVAWVRMMLAYVAVFGLPLLLLPNLLPLGAVLATPFVFVRDLIVQKQSPFFKWGYLAVAAMGPIALYAMFFARPTPGVGREEQAAMLLIVAFIFELTAPIMIMVYVLLWRIGDRWFAPGPGWRPRAKRLALAAVIVVGAALYVPAMHWWMLSDNCLDSGGRLGEGRVCER